MIKRYMPKKALIILILLILLSIVSSFITSTIPGIFSKIIDKGILTGNTTNLLKLVILILTLSLLNSIIKIYNNMSINKMGQFVSQGLKETIIKKVFRSPLNFFDQVGTGELVSRIKEVDAVASLFNPQFLNIMAYVITAIFAIIQVASIDYRLIGVYLVAFPVLLIFSYRFSKKYKNLTYDLIMLNTQVNQMVHESISGISEIKSNNLVWAKQNDVNKIHDEIYQKTKKQNTLFAFNTEILALINVLASLGITVVFCFLFKENKVSMGTYIEITQYGALILAPAQLASSILMMVQPILILRKRIKFFDMMVLQEDNRGESINKIKRIEVENLEFAYKDNKVLSDLNFVIKDNEKVLVNGKNGSGKTTLVKLLLRLYDNYEGRILFNEQDSRTYSIKSIREQIAVVFQETFLFDDSLYNNIICGMDGVSKNEVMEVVKYCGLADNLKELSIEELLDIKIIEGGKNLSGGQKRMIAIARALLKKPSVLILDEPTTFLDKEAKEYFMNFISGMKDIIVIVVSHDRDMKDSIERKINI
jgi:ATP-binding cassette subfamily B protein